MTILGVMFLTVGIAGMVSLFFVVPYKPKSLRDYAYLVTKNVGITSLVIVFALTFALGIVLLVGK